MLGMLGLFAVGQIFSVGFSIYNVVQTTSEFPTKYCGVGGAEKSDIDLIVVHADIRLCWLTKRGVFPFLFIPGVCWSFNIKIR